MPHPIARFQAPDAWALVTGASDGIGKSYCWALADHGFNLILHGRNRSKLEAVEADLNHAHPHIRTYLWVADASAASFSHDDLMAALAGKKVTVLINNVGGVVPLASSEIGAYRTLPEYTTREMDEMLNLNVRFPTEVTRVLLGEMKTLNMPCLVISMGSMASFGAPYLSVYAGTKGYIVSWSRSLACELLGEKSPIKVIGIQCGSVESGSHKKGVSWSHPSSQQYVKCVLGKVGGKKAVMTPYWPHWVQGFMLSCIPEGMAQKAFIKTMEGFTKPKRA